MPAGQLSVTPMNVPNGSLFAAPTPNFQEQLLTVLPGTRHAVVILSLQDEDTVVSMWLKMGADYAKALRRHESRLMPVGLAPDVIQQVERTRGVLDIGLKNLFKPARRLAIS